MEQLKKKLRITDLPVHWNTD